MSDKHRLLREVFGYPSFRPGQEGLVDALLAGRDAFGIMPTGAGKSVCYQLPALLLPGVTLVVISERIASLREADRILVLEDGKITAQGRHEELLSSSPRYRSMERLQMGGGSV